MKETLELVETFSVKPLELYNAWLDSELHGKMIGGTANCSRNVGDLHSAWDDYIVGKNLELVENQKIVQTWRTSEFAESDEDSILTIMLTEIPEGTNLKLSHTNIPEGQTQYEKGWIDHYFAPMKEFFG